MPGRWVTRKDLDGFVVAEPLACYVAHAIVAEPGVRTVEECIEDLLEEGESAQGDGQRLPITLDGAVVGFIEIRHRIT